MKRESSNKGPNNYGKVCNSGPKPKSISNAKGLSGGKLSSVPKPKGKLSANDSR